MLNDPEMKEIFESFITETKEILEKLDVDLIELEKDSQNKDLLNQIFRAFHTIKGTSGFLSLEKLQTLTHRCEDILNKLRKGEVLLNDDIMDIILKAFDSIKELMVVIETNKNEDYDVQFIIETLDKLLEVIENDDEIKKVMKEVGEQEQIANTSEIKTTGDKNEGVKSAQTSRAKPSKLVDNSIRVDVERLDELLNIVSELVLGRNRLSQINMDVANEYEATDLARGLAETTRQIDLMTTELQLAVMKTRMIKIGKVFNKFPRLVRDLSREVGKEIALEINGEETELDKTLIEEIHDPLVHLIRNSVDHGIESAEERKKVNKDAKGKIILSAEHEGNNIIIRIEDDGKGIDTEKIKKSAIKKGLITKDKAEELSENEVYNLIFLPGFSTAEKVSNVSGRGVGMDVVKTNVMKLRGIINIESEVGKGTKIIIKLPLTLAIIQGLLVQVAGNTIVLPLSTVVEVVRISKKKIHSVNGRKVINLRDKVLPLLNIHKEMFGINTNGKNSEWSYIVVLGIAEKRFGIVVDKLIGQKEVVIKSLGNYLGKVQGVAGSTIMGDGTVVIIADIAELLNKIAEEN
ncbi:MAG: chemotaxis protein CheA [Melioribacteraceae bacterium]|nr:chemotaxis protein CheA [Melioribacteraceae bacterium]MCF8353742.1 chemotaxis protein CheA [Melioribacteraceae bacterium]MCF8392449.1 chemotaxis protein CheA [Melioribacteraceae bacterium]MCF8418360.1 chemotaxis protein CheA [Melioribacteraceae bacterium]